jgi:hypothetical protein
MQFLESPFTNSKTVRKGLAVQAFGVRPNSHVLVITSFGHESGQVHDSDSCDAGWAGVTIGVLETACNVIQIICKSVIAV